MSNAISKHLIKGISQEEQDTFLHILDKIEKNCINYLNSTK